MARSGGERPLRPHDDAGLQPERTVLAWTRTTVSFLVTAGVLLKWTPEFGVPVLAVVGVLAAAALSILAGQRLRYVRRASGIVHGRVRANALGIAALTCCLLAVGAAEIVFTLL